MYSVSNSGTILKCKTNRWRLLNPLGIFSYRIPLISVPRSLFNFDVPNAPFLYPLKTSENLAVFECFQKVEQGCIGNKRLKRAAHIGGRRLEGGTEI